MKAPLLRRHAATLGFAALMLVLAAVVAAATAYHLVHLRSVELQRLGDAAAHHARVFESHLSHSLNVVDLTLGNLADGDVPGSEGNNNIWHRSSDYFGVNLSLTPIVTASSVIYAQPRFDRPLDFRILSDTVVTFTITKLLSAGVSGTVWYDNRPPAGVHTYDLAIKNSLIFKLQ